jgi:7,8-dihydro-6-hydroxymethylpterin dimethyltransferase
VTRPVALTDAGTSSLCPVCLRRVSARRTIEDDNVYLDKECPEHGAFRALLWRGAESYFGWAEGSRHGGAPNEPGLSGRCAEACGLCGEREGDTCIAVLHLTDRCNLRCPVCFADSCPAASDGEPSLADVERMLSACAEKAVRPSVQLSGGEVTLRDDLPSILGLAKDCGLPHVQVNTNGLKLAGDPEYAGCLARAGADVVYLQFDGVTEDVFRTLRGRDLLQVKVKALKHCREAGLGVILVPTVLAGVNDHQLGDLVRFAKDWIPTVRGVQFQMLSFFGRYPAGGECDERRVTLPDVVRALETQTGGEVAATAVTPRRKYDAHCSFSSVFLLDAGGNLCALGSADDVPAGSGQPMPFDPFAAEAVAFARKYWRAGSCRDCGGRAPTGLAAQIGGRLLTLSGMHFQDAWTIDLERVRGCCVHVVTPACDFVPLCLYYLTSVSGRRPCALS